MSQVKSGDTVKVRYTGTLGDGSIFDTSSGREPLEFTIGLGQVIPGFEEAIVGMTPGDSKTAKILSQDAYGPHRPEMVIILERDRVPADIEPEVGQHLQIKHESGHTFDVRITDVSQTSITLDANHPLAGKDLTFDIMLEAIA